jgi:LruC domain-containing protein
MKFFYESLICASLCVFASCTQGLEDGTSKNGSETVDTNFKFTTRTNHLVSLTAINETGKKSANALFSIYTTDPSNGDGGRYDSIYPIFQGYTNVTGDISVTLSIPDACKKLYVYPEYAWYGYPQEVAVTDLGTTMVFDGSSLTRAVAATRNDAAGTGTDITRDPVNKGGTSKYYSYFVEDGTGKEFEFSDGSLIPGAGVVSTEELTEGFKSMVNAMFPEQEKKAINHAHDADLAKTTDIHVTSDAGAKMWVTFIGDGGYSTKASNWDCCNSLAYYTYTADEKPDKDYDVNYLSSDKYHLTVVLPNVNPRYIATGTRVQMLYYDRAKGKYVETFPKGTYVGFDLNYCGYNAGYKYTSNKRGFACDGDIKKLKDGYCYQYCSSAAFNYEQETHGILLWNDTYKCYIVGMERQGNTNKRYNNGKEGDKDFNDILAKLTVTPNDGTAQEEAATAQTVEQVTSTQVGTLAFEDGWPNKGDYDFNDFVTEYEYTLGKNTQNQVFYIRLKFTPKAVGASYNNGFAVELPVDPSNIDVANITGGATLEDAAASKAVIVVYNNVRGAFDGAGGFINTSKGSSTVTGASKDIIIPLVNPVAESTLAYDTFNPFLIINGNRGREVHLVDHTPTSKADMSLLGTSVDKSDAATGVYYRMDNRYPWAIDLSTTTWQWPYENVVITEAYPTFGSWYEKWSGGTSANWYTNSVNGKVFE